ncbi:Gata zinc finger domain-containing protein [Mycena indigotica]|uniref:Gata zinc finger domain-containing protein n=1 Tax=Mycena indigotica TaxID=2126181 RepID=A0A8H6SGX9_9AGAR|nr:Gata zinc finger domain-containing protein [Mycena indigotica]KAF7298605.1 Gata zinc finger domain-containing protein [Mycena indigotica]
MEAFRHHDTWSSYWQYGQDTHYSPHQTAPYSQPYPPVHFRPMYPEDNAMAAAAARSQWGHWQTALYDDSEWQLPATGDFRDIFASTELPYLGESSSASSPSSSNYLPSPLPDLRVLALPSSPSASATSSPPPRRSSTDSTASTKSGKVCAHCAATSTPLWRRDPATHRPLCNACGLYLQQRNKMRPAALIAADQRSDEEDGAGLDGSEPTCSHCQTRKTSVWRRSKTGQRVCNACGVYQRLRGRDRPLNLRRNKIRPRCKHPLPK